MKSFDAKALRRALAGGRPDAARDLVRRTLAQHGLMPEGDNADPTTAPDPLARNLAAGQAAMTEMAEMLGRAMPPLTASPLTAPQPLVPGASFRADHFTCKAGARDYLTYIPASAAQGASALIVMLHGCTQTPADFAAGTGMNALAEEYGFIVAYPQQSRGQNAQSCWNWFSPGDQQRGRGEPEILAGIATHLAKTHDIPPARTFVAGLSAGAAMAVILGQGYPDVFAAVGAHSGLPYGAARDLPSALAVMAGQGGVDPARSAGHRATPSIIFQGSVDHTVNPANADRIARDVLEAGPQLTLFDTQSGRKNGRSFTRETTRTEAGDALLEYWRIEGLGHAWSGGQPAGSYTDPAGPDASAEMVRFFLQSGHSEGGSDRG